jgi:hypothetical protein
VRGNKASFTTVERDSYKSQRRLLFGVERGKPRVGITHSLLQALQQGVAVCGPDVKIEEVNKTTLQLT